MLCAVVVEEASVPLRVAAGAHPGREEPDGEASERAKQGPDQRGQRGEQPTAWNGFLFPLIFTLSESMRPLTVGLATFADTTGSFGLNMAAATVNFLPTFAIYMYFQRYFVKGLALGGMKL